MAYDGGAPRRCSSPSSVCVQQTDASGWRLVAPVCSVVSTPSAGVSSVSSTPGVTASTPTLGPRAAAAAAAARQRMAVLSDAVSLQSDPSSSRLGPSISYRDIGPTISDIRVVLPKSSVSRDFILGCDSPWSGPKRCAAAFAASGADFSLESLVRALPPPLPPPVLLQRTPPSSLEDARHALEPTTLIQTICSGVSGSPSSAYVQQSRVASGVAIGKPNSPASSTNKTSSYTGFPCNKSSEPQVSKEISTEDKGTQQEDLFSTVRAITCNIEEAEDADDSSSGVASGSAPDVEHTLFNLISCMTKSLGSAGQKHTQHAAGDAPGLQRAPVAAAATVAAAAAAAAVAAASSMGAPRTEGEGRRAPFVFECNHEPIISPSLSSFSGHGTEDGDATDPESAVKETKSPSQTLSEFLRAISKENEEGESYGGRARAQCGTGAAAGGGASAAAGLTAAGTGATVAGQSPGGAARAGSRRGAGPHPAHGAGGGNGRLASRSRRRGKRRPSARRGRSDARTRRRRSRGRSANAAGPITVPPATGRGLSRDRRRRSRAARRTSAELRRRKHKATAGQRAYPMARHVPEEEATAPSQGGMVGGDDNQQPRSYADVLDRLARQDSSPLLRGRRVGDKRRRAGGPGSRKPDVAVRRGRGPKPGSRSLPGVISPRTAVGASQGGGGGGGGGSNVGGGASISGVGVGSIGAASTTSSSPASGPLCSLAPRLPGGSPTPRPGTRLEAAVAAAVAAANQAQGGRGCAGTPPAPPPSPASSKRSAVAAYASNPMLVPPGDSQEAGDCSEDSLAFWLRIICGPQRDGEAVDSLVRSQQHSMSPRKCALGAAKTIWARADPPCSTPTQSSPSSKVCGGQRRAKLPVYLLPKASATKGASLSNVQTTSSPPLIPPPPIWAPQCTLPNKGMDCGDWPMASTRLSGCPGLTSRAKLGDGVRPPKRTKCSSKTLTRKSSCVHCPTCGVCAHAAQAAARRCSCKSCPCTAHGVAPDTGVEWSAAAPPRPRRRKARASPVGPAATFASTPTVSEGLRESDNVTSGGSWPHCLAQWCMPHPSLASSPSFVTEVARAHGCTVDDQHVMKNLPRFYRSLGAKGDGEGTAHTVTTPADSFCDGLTERARRKAWMRSLAKRRSWLRSRVSAHALLARAVHRRICPKGQSLLPKPDPQSTPGSKEGQGEPSSPGREAPRREATSAPLLAREVAPVNRRSIRDRRTPPAGSSGTCTTCAGAAMGGVKRRRVRCAFTSSPLPQVSVHPGTTQLVAPFTPLSSPRHSFAATTSALLSSQAHAAAASLQLSTSPVGTQSTTKPSAAGRTPSKRVSFQRGLTSHGSPSFAGCSHGQHNSETQTVSMSPRMRPRDVIMVECTPRRSAAGTTTGDRVRFKDTESSQRSHPSPRNLFRDTSPHHKLQRDQNGLKDADGSTGAVPRSILWQTGKRGGRQRGDSGPSPSSVHPVPPPFTPVVSSPTTPTHPTMFKRSTRLQKPTRLACQHHDRQAFSAKQRNLVDETVGWAGTTDRPVAAAAAAAVAGNRRINASEKSHVKTPPSGSGGTNTAAATPVAATGVTARSRAHVDDVENATVALRTKSRGTKTPVSSEGRSVRGSDFDRSDKSKRQPKAASQVPPQKVKRMRTTRENSPDSVGDGSKSSHRRMNRRTTSSSPDSRADSKRSDSKRSDSKRSDSKRSESKRSDSKRSDAKRSDSKRSESKRSTSKRSEHNRSETKMCDSTRSDSKRVALKHSDQHSKDIKHVDTKHCESKHSEGTHSLGKTKEEIAVVEKKSLLQLFFHGEMYSSHTESERSTSDKETPDPPKLRTSYLIDMNEEECRDRRRDASGHRHPWIIQDSIPLTVVSNPLLTKSIRINVVDDACYDQPPIQPVIRVSHHRKFQRFKERTDEYVTSVLKEGGYDSVQENSDVTAINDFSCASKTDSISVVEISLSNSTNSYNPDDKLLNIRNMCPVRGNPLPVIRIPITADVDNSNKSETTPNTGSLPSSNVLPTCIDTKVVPPLENTSLATASKRDEVVCNSEESDKKSTASTLRRQDSSKDENNLSVELKKNNIQVEITSPPTSSDPIPGEVVEPVTTNELVLKKKIPENHENVTSSSPEIKEPVIEQSAEESKNRAHPALAADPLRQLPQASRTTLVKTWNAHSYIPSPPESDRESTVDTYSLICSRSTPSLTESRRDTWITPSSSSSFSTVYQEESKLPVMCDNVSINQPESALSNAPFTTSNLSPHDVRIAESTATPEIFESTDSFDNYFKKQAEQTHESDSREEMITAESSSTKLTENENVQNMISLQMRSSIPSGYAYPIKNLYCSSDDSADFEEDRSVCLVISSSTVSQVSDTSTEVTDSTVSRSSAREPKLTLVRETSVSPPETRPPTPCSGTWERAEQSFAPLINVDRQDTSPQLNYHNSYPQQNDFGPGSSVFVPEDRDEVDSWVSNGEAESDLCMRPPSQAARSSVAPSELSHGEKGSLTLLVCDSEGSHTDADANNNIDGDDITLLMLEHEEQASCRARCLRGAGLAPDLVSDLPAPATDPQRQSSGRGRERLRALLEEVQQLQAHKRPESAPASGADLTVTAERLVSDTPKVRDRIYEFNRATAAATVQRPASAHRSVQITNSSSKVKERIKAFNTGRVRSEEGSQNGNENFSECLEKIPALEETDILGECMKREYMLEMNSRFTVDSPASDEAEASSTGILTSRPSDTVLPSTSPHDAAQLGRTTATSIADRASDGAEDGGLRDGTTSAAPSTMETRSVSGEGKVIAPPRTHSRAVSALVATLAAAYLWYNMYVS